MLLAAVNPSLSVAFKRVFTFCCTISRSSTYLGAFFCKEKNAPSGSLRISGTGLHSIRLPAWARRMRVDTGRLDDLGIDFFPEDGAHGERFLCEQRHEQFEGNFGMNMLRKALNTNDFLIDN